MSLRNTISKSTFNVFESDNISDFETALNDALCVLEEKGMNGENDEPEVTLVLRNTIPGADGYRKIQAIVYIGATTQDISQHLNKKI